MFNKAYILITPARNEEVYIEETIKSILGQKIIPMKWVIVSDTSNDRTDEIVKQYAREYDFINYLRLDKKNNGKNFASKVHAINIGYEKLKDLKYGFIGNLDADISIGEDYYENILEKFQENGKLGIAGGFIYEKHHGQFKNRLGNDARFVPGAIQLFRRECYEEIDGYVPISVGGEDTIAVISARMKGWEVKAFPEFRVFHHKRGVDVRGMLRECFRDGSMGFALGSDPLFEILKSFRRINRRPFLIYTFVRLVGFFSQYCCGKGRVVNKEFIKFLRHDQFIRIKLLFS
jgi:glycosyltransferase involved in cell wall biosynthesis